MDDSKIKFNIKNLGDTEDWTVPMVFFKIFWEYLKDPIKSW